MKPRFNFEKPASAGAKILPPKRQIAVLAGKKFSPLMNNRKPGIHGALHSGILLEDGGWIKIGPPCK